VAQDDYRIRVELEAEEQAESLLDRLRRGPRGAAHELVQELERDRLVASGEGHVVFVYADSATRAARAREVVVAELAEHGLRADVGPVEHWLDDEDRWQAAKPPVREADRWRGPRGNREVPPTTRQAPWETELTSRGMAPWEVRVECESHREAEQLADRLEGEGYGVIRRWRYMLVGAGSREEADELAARLHGEAEPTSELVWEVMPGNPFAVFGGLGT
jgi:hypothetical protein